MKFINQSAQIVTEKDPYKKIETAGRTCYRSEDKITEDSALKFTKGLIKSGHTAMVEHQVFTFQLTTTGGPFKSCSIPDYINLIARRPFYKITCQYGEHFRFLVSANVRAINETGLNDPLIRALKKAHPDLVYINIPEAIMFPGINAEIVDIDTLEYVTAEEILAHKHLTFQFTTNRAVTHELVRHRICSFAQESTRYCGYHKDKFGGELTFIQPADYETWPDEIKAEHKETLENIEQKYLKWVSSENGIVPQQARDILPNGISTNIVVTANMQEWNHIFNLRYFGTTGAPHPDIKELMSSAYKLAKKDPIAAMVLTKG